MSGPDRNVFLESLAIAYLDTQNPMHVWQAIHLCETCDFELPEWVKDYLYDSAYYLNIVKDRPPKRDVAESIVEALGFSVTPGRGSAFSKLDKQELDSWLFLHVVELIENGTKEYLAVEDVAKFLGVSRSTVRRAYKRGVREGWDQFDLRTKGILETRLRPDEPSEPPDSSIGSETP